MLSKLRKRNSSLGSPSAPPNHSETGSRLAATSWPRKRLSRFLRRLAFRKTGAASPISSLTAPNPSKQPAHSQAQYSQPSKQVWEHHISGGSSSTNVVDRMESCQEHRLVAAQQSRSRLSHDTISSLLNLSVFYNTKWGQPKLYGAVPCPDETIHEYISYEGLHILPCCVDTRGPTSFRETTSCQSSEELFWDKLLLSQLKRLVSIPQHIHKFISTECTPDEQQEPGIAIALSPKELRYIGRADPAGASKSWRGPRALSSFYISAAPKNDLPVSTTVNQLTALSVRTSTPTLAPVRLIPRQRQSYQCTASGCSSQQELGRLESSSSSPVQIQPDTPAPSSCPKDSSIYSIDSNSRGYTLHCIVQAIDYFHETTLTLDTPIMEEIRSFSVPESTYILALQNVFPSTDKIILNSLTAWLFVDLFLSKVISEAASSLRRSYAHAYGLDIMDGHNLITSKCNQSLYRIPRRTRHVLGLESPDSASTKANDTTLVERVTVLQENLAGIRHKLIETVKGVSDEDLWKALKCLVEIIEDRDKGDTYHPDNWGCSPGYKDDGDELN